MFLMMPLCVDVVLFCVFFFLFFFFKQKTAYEHPLRLVVSDMCIRDRLTTAFTSVFRGIMAHTFSSAISVIILGPNSVSYTHLTLPTTLRVLISVVVTWLHIFKSMKIS